jgi:hypothetical protein
VDGVSGGNATVGTITEWRRLCTAEHRRQPHGHGDSNVNSPSFGKLFSYSLDGLTFASPLYIQDVTILARAPTTS